MPIIETRWSSALNLIHCNDKDSSEHIAALWCFVWIDFFRLYENNWKSIDLLWIEITLSSEKKKEWIDYFKLIRLSKRTWQTWRLDATGFETGLSGIWSRAMVGLLVDLRWLIKRSAAYRLANQPVDSTERLVNLSLWLSPNEAGASRKDIEFGINLELIRVAASFAD